MTGSQIFSQFLSGVSRGMILFFISSGLTLIFGVMNILNFAHASFWLVGAYFTWTFWKILYSPAFGLWISIPLAALTMAGIGWIIEVILIRRIYERSLPEQLLLTYALVLIIGDVIKLTWGVENRIVSRPKGMDGFVNLFGAPFPTYYIFVIGLGGFVAWGLWWLLHKTKFGRTVRASVFSREMVGALGIPVHRIYAGVFALSLFIAGLAGGVQAPISSITLGMDMSIIVECFAVVVIGGFGSLPGALVGSLIVGLVYAFAILVIPKMALVLIFVVTAIVLIVRPWGLFGTPMRA
jgi:branched-subunit amino acid ABC-type transport system permease component